MPAGAEPEPRFRRPTPDDAVRLARERFDAGEQLDLQRLARQLGVSRATVHRWFGTRDHLVTLVFAAIARDIAAGAEEQASGRGDERVLDAVRRMSAAAADHPALRVAAEREPGLSLRLVLDAEGPVRPQIAAAVRRLVAAAHPPGRARALDERLDLLVDAAIALQWATFAIGRQPDPERAVELARALLEPRAPRGRARPVSRARPAASGTG